ncbi:MAG: iron complex transport system substrate-binding protein [Mucilaginibacter sp.]|nr:iron complex transport system substrate-binding protein [Mucilaginibacter sp.]
MVLAYLPMRFLLLPCNILPGYFKFDSISMLQICPVVQAFKIKYCVSTIINLHLPTMYTKIVSLLPAATEIVCALGLEKNLVGRSHECDFPESVKQLPVCSEANFPDGLGSAAIDVKVKEILADALSLYTVNREMIKQLAPDTVITQAQCEVCAVSLKDVEEALDNYLDKKAQIISLQPNSLDDIFTDIKTIANSLNVSDVGNDLLERLYERVDIVRHKLKFIADKPTVACIEWLEPLMLSGNWIPELAGIAGGNAILAEAGKHSPYVQWDDIRIADPEIIILMPCGFAIERTLKEMDIMLELPGFTEMKAVKNNRVYIADGNQYFNRPGPRIVDSIEILAEIIYPKQFIFGYEGNGWIKFSL